MEEQRLETRIRQREEVSVVEVRGEIDLATVPVFKDAVVAAASRSGHVIIDMAGVTYMDSSGFGTLLSATKRLKPSGGSVSLVGCNDIIRRMLNITRLNTIFKIHDSEEDALRSLPVGSVSRNGSAAH